ncbi:MAG TPA: PorP/SprF family type IX secretion system membrane protein [Flavobacteriales bacterium]|nr:PorP/SprF family type IX secretion system membrane protein [Flavobacteriales bacterium]HRJ39184.1 PorP/SprF family type IX secretion system membrane protein [Flavobacteriales bacterium]
MTSTSILYRFLLVIFLTPLAASAQQIPLYNHYHVNPFVYNPSLSGYSGKTNAYFIRNQKYLGFEGGNVTNILTVDGPIFANKVGIGFSVFNDQMGPSIAQGAGLSLSYRVEFSEKIKLGFGFTGGATDRRFDPSNVVVVDNNDPTLVFSFPIRKTYFDLSAGIYLDVDRFQFGVAVPQMLANTVRVSMDNSHILERHYMGHLKYNWLISPTLDLSLIPLARVMYVPGAPFQYDVNITADLKKIGWITATYRSQYAVAANIGFRIKQDLVFGYAYNFVMNTTNAYGPVNQEILVGYTFGVKSNDREKKLLEEAERENERLRQELLRKQKEYDSLNTIKEGLDRRIDEQERYYNDTINKLNEELRKLREDMKNTQTKVTEVKNTNDGPPVKRTEGDHFVELDKSTESPKGYYVIDGAYGSMENAQSQYDRLKGQFPEARIIFNERNQLHYILLTYSEDKPKVFDTHRKAKSIGEEKAWVLEYR